MGFLWNIFQTLFFLFSSEAQWAAAAARPLFMQMGSNSISNLANATKMTLLISFRFFSRGFTRGRKSSKAHEKKCKDSLVLEPTTSHELAQPSYTTLFKMV